MSKMYLYFPRRLRHSMSHAAAADTDSLLAFWAHAHIVLDPIVLLLLLLHSPNTRLACRYKLGSDIYRRDCASLTTLLGKEFQSTQ